MSDFAKARQNMVDCQLRTNKIIDPDIIDAFGSVPRESFVEEQFVCKAYADDGVQVGKGRRMMEPMILARMVQELAIEGNNIVLDVGCATGYSSAILARLATTVVALECDSDLATRASETLGELAVDNAVVVEGKLDEGYATQGPYDVICMEGTVSAVPDGLLDQLADGGRLVAIISEDGRPGQVVLMLKRSGLVSSRIVCNGSAAALPGFERKPGFVF
jgi:protein-L-isoaspartate(D-aspartate) O-methyltransferase